MRYNKIKCKKIMLTFLSIMLIGMNSFAYANETNQGPRQTETGKSRTTEEDLVELYQRAGLASPEVIINTLANLGISNEELQEYVGQGKKISDILGEKAISMINFKKALSTEYSCRIKEATKSKVITKKEAKVLKDLLKERMSNWDI